MDTDRYRVPVFLIFVALGAVLGAGGMARLAARATPPGAAPVSEEPQPEAAAADRPGAPSPALTSELAAIQKAVAERRAAIAAITAPPPSLDDLVRRAALRVRAGEASPARAWSDLGRLGERALEAEADRFGVELWELGCGPMNERLFLLYCDAAGFELAPGVRAELEANQREAEGFWVEYMAAREGRTRLERALAGIERAVRWGNRLADVAEGVVPGGAEFFPEAPRWNWSRLYGSAYVQPWDTVESAVETRLSRMDDPDERVRARPHVLGAAHAFAALDIRFPRPAKPGWLLEEEIEVLRILSALERRLIDEARLSPEAVNLAVSRYFR